MKTWMTLNRKLALETLNNPEVGFAFFLGGLLGLSLAGLAIVVWGW